MASIPSPPQIQNVDTNHHFIRPSDLSLLETGDFSDAVIICGDKTWKIHKSIICVRCDWFRKALDGNFQEAVTNSVTIPDSEFSPELIDCFISYVYSGVVDFDKVHGSRLETCVRLWAVADFFIFEPLLKDALTMMENHFDGMLVRVMDQTDLWTRLTEGLAFVDQLFSGISAAYIDYPHAIPVQKLILDFVYAGMITWSDHPRFRKLLPEAPHDFTHALMVATVNGNNSRWTNKLPKHINIIPNDRGCTWCHTLYNDLPKYEDRWAIDSRQDSIRGELYMPWRCMACVNAHGLHH